MRLSHNPRRSAEFVVREGKDDSPRVLFERR
jgi:hypothetical protein